MLQKRNLVGKKATKIWPSVELVLTYPAGTATHFNTVKESLVLLWRR